MEKKDKQKLVIGIGIKYYIKYQSIPVKYIKCLYMCLHTYYYYYYIIYNIKGHNEYNIVDICEKLDK